MALAKKNAPLLENSQALEKNEMLNANNKALAKKNAVLLKKYTQLEQLVYKYGNFLRAVGWGKGW
jgi:hypothetical protein